MVIKGSKLKLISISLTFFCLPVCTLGQNENSSYDHIAAGFYGGLGEGFAYQMDMSVHFRSKLFTRLHMLNMSLDPENIPDDYSPWCFLGSCEPKNQLFILSGIVGRKLVDNKSFSFSIEAGLSWVKLTTVEFELASSGGFFGPSYHEIYSSENTPGLMLMPRVEAKISPATSIQLTIVGNINSVNSVVIPGVGLVFRSKGHANKPKPLPAPDQHP